jgi:hypothetical protein
MKKYLQPLSQRVLSRLQTQLFRERDPWLHDDIKIACLTVTHAARGDAVCCPPDVLASYEVLGLHPDKVWPAIEARRNALDGDWMLSGAPPVPKKPAQSVKLWCEKTNGARAANSHAGMQQGSPRTTISVPMAAPSIAALYANPQASSSGKSGAYSYAELLRIVRHSHAPHSIKSGTLNALTARGRWPGEDGPAHGVICVSLDGMMLGDDFGSGQCVRSTARFRARRAVKLGYWRKLRNANSWSNCRKCGSQREAASCEKCGYVGRSKTPEGKANFDEFCRPHMYEIDIEKFRSAPPPKGISHFHARTYKEHRERLRQRGSITEMPAPKPPENNPPPRTPAPARPTEPLRKTAQHQRAVTTEISERARVAAHRIYEFCGLADEGIMPQLEASVIAEAKFRGIEVEDAAKLISESALYDQRNGVTLNRFYFRDVKWRSNATGQASPAEVRVERSQRNILEGLLKNARRTDAPDKS